MEGGCGMKIVRCDRCKQEKEVGTMVEIEICVSWAASGEHETKIDVCDNCLEPISPGTKTATEAALVLLQNLRNWTIEL